MDNTINIMEQPTLTPSAPSSSTASLLPIMPTSWFSSLEKKPAAGLDDRALVFGNTANHHRLSSDGGVASRPNADNHGNNNLLTRDITTTNNTYLEVRQPVPLKPLMPAAMQSNTTSSTSTSTSSTVDSMFMSAAKPLPSQQQHFALHTNTNHNNNIEDRDFLQLSFARMPMNAPQLRMRPVAAVAKKGSSNRNSSNNNNNSSNNNNTVVAMPSPIARRGEAERAFLQRQMKAEARIRREQARHNQERRKLRMENHAKAMMSIGHTSCMEEDENEVEDEENELKHAGNDAQQHAILEMTLHNTADDGKQNHHHHRPTTNFLPNNRKHGRQQFLREFGASSPPLILKKSFKRSVSAVLADSGIAENENLLFFPDGLPLLNEKEDVGGSGGVATVHNDATADGDCAVEACSPGGGGGGGNEGSVNASPEMGMVPDELLSTANNNEPSPSLIAADVIWQIGASSCEEENDDLADELPMPHQLSKKVTLRPKMNAPCLTSSSSGPPRRATHEFQPIGAVPPEKSCLIKAMESSTSTAGCSDLSNNDKRPYEFARRGGRFSCDVLSASESFQHLSVENDDNRVWGTLNRSDSMGRSSNCDVSNNKVPPPYTFSSPEPGGRNRSLFSANSDSSSSSSQQQQQHVENFLLKEPISESNYSTPDNSESKRFPRRLPSERLPKLPELGMPNINDINDEMLSGCDTTTMTVEEEEGEFEIVLNEHMSEINFYTPEITKP